MQRAARLGKVRHGGRLRKQYIKENGGKQGWLPGAAGESAAA
jgi:hypothetical protein